MGSSLSRCSSSRPPLCRPLCPHVPSLAYIRRRHAGLKTYDATGGTCHLSPPNDYCTAEGRGGRRRARARGGARKGRPPSANAGLAGVSSARDLPSDTGSRFGGVTSLRYGIAFRRSTDPDNSARAWAPVRTSTLGLKPGLPSARDPAPFPCRGPPPSR